MEDPEPEDGISVALSGGGHRAALFAAGALLGLVDAGVNRRVRTIASVSGGSITHGLVASRGEFDDDLTSGGFEAWLAPGLTTFHRDGLFFPGPRTDGFVARFFLLLGATLGAVVVLVSLAVGIGQDVSWGTGAAVAATATAVLLVAALAARRVRPDVVRPTYARGLAAGALLTLLVAPALVWAPGGDQPTWLSVLSPLVAVGLVIGTARSSVRWFARRGQAVAEALDHGLYAGARLRDVDRRVHHVFCATNLSSGAAAYLTPRLVSGWLLGTARPAPTLRLATAVQASAAFPGGFPPERHHAADLFDPSDTVAETATDPRPVPADLADGGVYDNMGDQWELGWVNRSRRLAAATPPADLAAYGTVPYRVLVVVNAGGHFATGSLPRGGLRREVRALLKDKDVMYDQTTSIRRRWLYDGFVRGEPRRGAIIQIAQVPRTVPQGVAEDGAPPEVLARAAQATALLDRLAADDPEHACDEGWARTARDNRDYATTLAPVPLDRAARLLWQGYVLARINTYVLLGEGSLPTSDTPDRGQWSLRRFVRLLERSA